MQIPRKMSAHQFMASIGRTLGTRHCDSKRGNQVKLAGLDNKEKEDEHKKLSPLVRVLTVVAYIISVSLAAIVLSLYYMYIWVPSDYPQYKRANYTATTAASAARVPCLDVSLAAPGEHATVGARRNATSTDASTPMVDGPSTEPTPPLDSTSGRDLLKTLTSPRADAAPAADDYPSSTDLPAMASISSEQFQAMPAAGGDYPGDGTIEPADDPMDE